MLKRVLVILVLATCALPMLAQAAAWKIGVKAMTAGGTIAVRGGTPQGFASGTVYYNYTTTAANPKKVNLAVNSASTCYAIQKVVYNTTTVTNPSSPWTRDFTPADGASQTAIAYFYAGQLSVSASVAGNGGGSVSPTSAANYTCGSTPGMDIVYKFTPNAGGSVAGISNVPAGASQSGAFNVPNGAVTITIPKALAATLTGNVPMVGTFSGVLANAGTTQTAVAGQPVTLNGSATPAAGATFSWTPAPGNPAPISLSDPTSATPSFTAPAANGTYNIILSVNGGAATATASVFVTNSITAGAALLCANCHKSSGMDAGVYANWSTSKHSRFTGSVCQACHVGTANGAHPGTLTSGTVNAASFTYLKGGAVFCLNCHNPAIVNGFNASTHKTKNLTCSACHTGGVHDPDFNPASCNGCHVDASGNVANHPLSITSTCTACHDPHTLVATVANMPAVHYNNITSGMYPASYVTSRASCADCHTASTENATIRGQWAASGHAATSELPWIDYDFKTRSGCVQCHTTTGFIAFSSARVTAAWGTASDKTKEVLTCVGCHSDIAAGTVRTVTPVKPFADEASYQNRNVGTSNICMDCHSGRNNGASIQVKIGAAFDLATSAFIAPHYLSAGGSLQGKSGYHFPGRSYANYSSNSHRMVGTSNTLATGTAGPCVTCHMTSASSHSYQPVNFDQNGAITALTTTECANCHASALPAATLDADRVSFNNALAVLNAQLTAINHPYSPIYPYFAKGNWGAGQAGANVMGAAFNYKLLLAEPGAYAHNSAYAKQLIVDSIDAAANGGTVTGDITSALLALQGSGAITSDQAASLNSYKSAGNCATCHNNATGSHTAHLSNGLGCVDCHSLTAASNSSLVYGNKTHLNGIHDVNFAAGGSYVAGTCSNVYCHSNGAAAFASPVWGNGSSNCYFCHPLSSLGGAHAAHVGSVIPASYGDTANSSTAGEYRFGCGSCHPTDLASHRDGHIEVTLVPTADGSLRSKNNPAVLIGGIGNSGSGITGISGSSVVCSAAYCHSNGGVGAALQYAPSPDWYNAAAYTGDKCAMCHGNAPATGAHAKHAVSIHTGQIVGSDGLLTLGHGDSVPATIINCDLCHSATVTNYLNDNSTGCTSCHKSDAKGTPTLDRTRHLNGSVDVAFKAVNLVTKAQVRPTSFNAYSTVWTRTSYKAGAGSLDTSKQLLSQGGWDGAGNCSNIACHNGGRANWSAKLSCVDCHSAL